MRYFIMVCLIVFTSTAFAGEDITATYKYQDGNTVTLVTRDSGHVRMDVSPENYMLLQKGKVYSVSKGDEGEWMVMDMDQMKGLASGGFAGIMAGGQGPMPIKQKEQKAPTVEYEKTGKKEQIAGYSGLVYIIKTMEGGKIVSREEIVLCNHGDLKKVNDAWTAVAVTMSNILGGESAGSIEKAAKEAKTAGYGGMLRYGNEITLESLKKQSLDGSIYEMPAGAQIINMGGMQGMPQGMMNQTEED